MSTRKHPNARFITSLQTGSLLLAFALIAGCGSSGGTTGFGLGDGGDDGSGDDGSLGLGDVNLGDGSTCVPVTCASAGVNCGPIGDGCGGLIKSCGDCTGGLICGGGGKPSVCGTTVNDGGGCLPLTCATAGANCGPIGDGCGGSIDCGTCPSGQSCGGGGTPSVCGVTYAGDAGPEAGGCVPRSCTDAGANCGPVADGCGGLLDCGKCTAPLICGGGGKASVCGDSFLGDSGTACTPRTCKDVGANCGPIGDGCGGFVDCGTCSAPFICGGGGTPSVCGNPFVKGDSGVACTPRTCKDVGANCGPVADGCGGLLSCGTCTAPFICGGGGTPSVCGNPFVTDAGTVCTPKSCSDLGANCGFIGDGCGGTANCGTCISPDICGGGGKPSVCGGGSVDAGSTTCKPGDLCSKMVACPGPAGTTTTISGTVFAPTVPHTVSVGGVPTAITPDPLYNATVYIPKSGVPAAISDTLTCDRCGSGGGAASDALVSAVTGPDGKFVLKNVPVGTSIPIVIELGKWRRLYTIPNVSACVDNPLAADATRLPRWEKETSAYDNIPRMALATGNVDALECVLRKMGIDDREYVAGASSGTSDPHAIPGRIQLYQGNGAVAATATPDISILTGNLSVLTGYDAVLLACEGFQGSTRPTADEKNLRDYAAAGGRLFATHYNFMWIWDNTGPTAFPGGPVTDDWSTTGNWSFAPGGAPTGSDSIPLQGLIDTGSVAKPFPKGVAFDQWLNIVGALAGTGPDYINIYVSRSDNYDDTATVSRPSQRWVYSTTPDTWVQQMTFNTPTVVPAAQQCGRVLFSDFHVNNGATAGSTFPAECQDLPLSAQEKVLEFEIFDLSSCVTADNTPPPPPPSCTPRTCADAGATCGQVADGCGGLTASCGTCAAGTTCGGGGKPYACGGPSCKAKTCTDLGFSCGKAGDGCGGTLDCGTCPTGTTCGGGGVPSVCGGPTCTAATSCPTSVKCGYVGDGCGGKLYCGDCTGGTTCGGSGVSGVCGGPTCTPTSCTAVGADCGKIGDGCGGTIDCGSCTTPDTCGGGGTPSKCGHSSPLPCKPRTCADAGATCGPVADGCGALLDCGKCTPPATCGGGGKPYTCGAPSCTPTTCGKLGYGCGYAADGCGGLLDCGSCTAPKSCGGGGVPNQCGGGVR